MLDEINKFVSEFDFFELSIHEYKNDKLCISGSDDFSYYHLIEIEFHSVFTIICNSYFKINPKNNFISLVNSNEEAIEINKKYYVEQGYNIYKLISEDNVVFYIIAKNISFKENTVKY